MTSEKRLSELTAKPGQTAVMQTTATTSCMHINQHRIDKRKSPEDPGKKSRDRTLALREAHFNELT